MDGRKLLQDRHHPEVILQGVKPNPWHRIHIFRQVLVKGLMHVPKKHDIRLRHSTGLSSFTVQKAPCYVLACTGKRTGRASSAMREAKLWGSGMRSNYATAFGPEGSMR